MHKKAKTFPLYSKSRIRYFRFIAKHKNSRGEEKTYPFCGEKDSGAGREQQRPLFPLITAPINDDNDDDDVDVGV